MTKNIFKRGFTLIELLVVIAIIGILASVVLASLNSARQKGSDAAAASSLNNMRAQAEIVYDDASPNSYAAVCTDSNVDQALDAATNAIAASTADCFDTDAAWAAGITLSDGTSYYCVDSTGYGGELAADPTLADANLTCL